MLEYCEDCQTATENDETRDGILGEITGFTVLRCTVCGRVSYWDPEYVEETDDFEEEDL